MRTYFENGADFVATSIRMGALTLAMAATQPCTTAKERSQDFRGVGKWAPLPIFQDENTAGALMREESPAEASTTRTETSLEQKADYVRQVLKRNDLIPDRETLTGDGSILFEFLSNRQACVDVYSNGDLIVIVHEDGIDNLYEFGIGDVDRVPALMRDGGNIG